MAGVTAPVTQQVIAKASIHDIILAQCPQIILSLDVKPLDLIEDIGLQQGVYIGRDGLHGWLALTVPLLQEALRHKRVADGADRGVVPNVVGQKEDDLPQKQCVCNGPLFLPAAALQDVPHYHSRVNAIQQHMDLFLIKPGFRNGWHPAEADVCLKQFPQIHHLSLFVNGPLPLAACGRLI